MSTYKAINSEIFIEQGDGNAAVAYIYHADGDDSEEDKRIATLFAAAPELLEELQQFQEISGEVTKALIHSGNLILADAVNSRHPLRYAAIKKALGK